MGYALRAETAQFRTLQVEAGRVVAIAEKAASENRNIYIGLAGIRDFELFWQGITTQNTEFIGTGESYGLRQVLAQGAEVLARQFSWFDTGNPAELARTQAFFEQHG